MVRRLKGERFHRDCIAPSFKSGRKTVMVWGCSQGSKLGPLVQCPSGRINATKYCNILEEHLLPFWKNLDPGSLFMQDGAPPHTANYTKAWLVENKVVPMVWPAQSPDLNPIENIWQQIKIAIEQCSARPKNEKELLDALQEEWEKLRVQGSLKTLIKSMRKHIRDVIRAKGMPINY
jgi:transposase